MRGSAYRGGLRPKPNPPVHAQAGSTLGATGEAWTAPEDVEGLRAFLFALGAAFELAVAGRVWHMRFSNLQSRRLIGFGIRIRLLSRAFRSGRSRAMPVNPSTRRTTLRNVLGLLTTICRLRDSFAESLAWADGPYALRRAARAGNAPSRRRSPWGPSARWRVLAGYSGGSESDGPGRRRPGSCLPRRRQVRQP